MAVSRAKMAKHRPSLTDLASKQQYQLTLDAESFAATFVKEVRRRRTELGWDQAALALESGVNRETIRGMEAGEGKINAPTLKTAFKLARALGLKIEITASPIIPARLTDRADAVVEAHQERLPVISLA